MIATCPNPSCRGEMVTYADPKSGGSLRCRRCGKTYRKDRWKWREDFTIYHPEQFVRASELKGL
jgi:tRNA(Ile2) C34 agmatinyltransferase TiaS